MTEMPRIRLGSDEAWVALEKIQADEETWRVAAEWCSWLSADFAAHLTDEEVADFAAQMLTGLPSRSRFSARVTPGRNNPLTLDTEPVGNGYAFYARLTPNGDDEVCHLQMELGPIDVTELHALFDALHATLRQ
ncbi:hypothetical protein ACWEQL_17360 [Kitasatospora sp. NPDC004240]